MTIRKHGNISIPYGRLPIWFHLILVAWITMALFIYLFIALFTLHDSKNPLNQAGKQALKLYCTSTALMRPMRKGLMAGHCMLVLLPPRDVETRGQRMHFQIRVISKPQFSSFMLPKTAIQRSHITICCCNYTYHMRTEELWLLLNNFLDWTERLPELQPGAESRYFLVIVFPPVMVEESRRVMECESLLWCLKAF